MESTSSLIVRCADCGTRNKIPSDKTGIPAKCGKCGSVLKTDGQPARPAEMLKIRCAHCGTKNRIPSEKISAGAKCGKCGADLQMEDIFTGKALMITDGNFEEKVIRSPLPVLLLAWAPWCPGCRTFMPVIDSYAAVAKGKVRVGKLNVEANPGLSSKYNILSVPFLFIFDSGRLKESLPAALQPHELMMKMADYI